MNKGAATMWSDFAGLNKGLKEGGVKVGRCRLTLSNPR